MARVQAAAQAVYQASSRAIARDLAEGVVNDHEAELPVRSPAFGTTSRGLHRPSAAADYASSGDSSRPPTSSKRLPVEERRRLKIILNAFGEKPVLKLMFGAMIRAAERWRAIKITTFERRQLDALRKELDHDYKAESGLEENHPSRPLKTEFPAVLGLDRRRHGGLAAVEAEDELVDVVCGRCLAPTP
ncbi:MAG: hypothetical protein R3D28_01080 [Geminicoccaceae bacterium]